MSIDFVTAAAFAFAPLRLRGPGRPANPLPAGLSHDVIQKLRKRAEKMSRGTNANFGVIYSGKVFAALADTGLARLSVKEVLSLAKMADDMPPELATIIASFLAAHPPVHADYAVMAEAIERGRVAGVNGLIKLHHHIRDRQRKAEAKRRAKAPKLSYRPKLLSPEELQQRRDAERAKAEAEALTIAKSALAALYEHRHDSRLLPWMTEFIECCRALHDSGFNMTPLQCEEIIGLHQELSAADMPVT